MPEVREGAEDEDELQNQRRTAVDHDVGSARRGERLEARHLQRGEEEA